MEQGLLFRFGMRILWQLPMEKAMNAADDPVAPAPGGDAFEREVRAVFQDTLGLIHIALVAHYQLGESEAVELEKDLYVWFVRFCYRPGNSSAREARPFLLVACCQFAREYQKYLLGSGVRSSDEKLKRLLEREPLDVAKDFSRSLELLSFRALDES
ncbi:MAG: hypothetical protein ABJC28_01465 [Acidobacteriota bacterium]